MKTGLHNLKLIVSLIALIIFDQLTKFWAVTQLKSGKVISIIPNVFELNYLDGGNTGAAWGIFSNVKLFVKYYAFNFNAVYNYFIDSRSNW